MSHGEVSYRGLDIVKIHFILWCCQPFRVGTIALLLFRPPPYDFNHLLIFLSSVGAIAAIILHQLALYNKYSRPWGF